MIIRLKFVKMTDSKTVVMAPANGLMDKSIELQKEILMEKLRSKTSQNKNLSETAKAVRMAMLVSSSKSYFLLSYFLYIITTDLYNS